MKPPDILLGLVVGNAEHGKLAHPRTKEGRREKGQRQKHLPITAEELTQARWLREAGIPMNAIARKLGRDASSLKNRLEKVSA